MGAQRWTNRLATGLLLLVASTAYGTGPTDPGNAIARPGLEEDWSRLLPLAGEAAARVTPIEARLFADAADAVLDEHTLVRAALVASGATEPDALARYEAKFATLADQLRHSDHLAGPPREQARAIFEWMHRHVLYGGYQADCSDLTRTLDEAKYNCISSAVLFNALAAACGMEACGVEMPGHAFSVVATPEGKLEVETTCRKWFEALDDPARQAELVEQATGHRHRTTEPGGERREVSDAELVAVLYYNRGVNLLARKDYAEALAANCRALRLDPASRTARGNLLATVNQWALALAAAGDFERALTILRHGQAVAPADETLRANDIYVRHQWRKTQGPVSK
jgi:tetratricopeptide (TPR) repeat protein